MVKSTSDEFSRDDIFPPLFYYGTIFPPTKKYTVICEFCKAEYIFKRKEKGLLIFDSTILNANFLFVPLDKDNVSFSNPAERGEVLGGKSPSSLNFV